MTKELLAFATAVVPLDWYGQLLPMTLCDMVPGNLCTECEECPFNSLQDWQRFKAKLAEEKA